MYIHEAIKKAKEEDKFITKPDFLGCKILTVPRMTCFIMHSDGSNKSKNWNPTEEDLLADDWLVCE